ncbi:hypothetical protein GCM10020001_104360 [Nonomuraea salmonea]
MNASRTATLAVSGSSHSAAAFDQHHVTPDAVVAPDALAGAHHPETELLLQGQARGRDDTAEAATQPSTSPQSPSVATYRRCGNRLAVKPSQLGAVVSKLAWRVSSPA